MKKIFLLIVILLSLFLFACANRLPDPSPMDTSSDSVTSTEQHPEKTESNINYDPPSMLMIEGVDQLNDLRIMSAESDERLNEYMLSVYGTVLDRDSITAFLKFLNTMPLLSVDGEGLKFSVLYFPQEPAIHFIYSVDDDHWYRFEYVLNQDTVAKVRDHIGQKGDAPLGNVSLDAVGESVGKDQTLTCLLREDFSEDQELSKRYAEIWAEMNGYLVKVICKNTDGDLSSVSLNNFFDDVYVTSLASLGSAK